LAIFFFVAGLELKREFIAGDLRDRRRAALPVAAAVGGMVVPALIYLAFNASSGDGALAGWAIPTATDIAFALAVLAVIGTHLPVALRTFLLSLAVVDDLFAITIIAVFYTSSLQPLPLALALIPLGVFALLVQRRVRSWWLLLPLAALTWVLVHESGVHATVAGVLLGFVVPVIRRAEGPGPGLAEHFEHRYRPISADLGRSRPVSRCPCSRSSPRGCPSPARACSVQAWVTRSLWASSPPSSWANSSVCWARRGRCSGSPAPSSPTG
jgi:NhaA family Na+:H+ antiporter